ncbi:hypothetical protein [Coleofasciculus sp. H7-2]|uniref:hypothetical protein n=1 Tax=Coleofasciculus sp. H7-2 TaxID=3351545 RepID=UPI00367266E8
MQAPHPQPQPSPLFGRKAGAAGSSGVGFLLIVGNQPDLIWLFSLLLIPVFYFREGSF